MSDSQLPAALQAAAERIIAACDPFKAWRRISKELLTPAVPFVHHKQLHRTVFAGWDGARGPAPVWIPSEEEAAATNLGQVGDWRAFHRASVAAPEAFWPAMLERLGIVADEPARRMVDVSQGADRAVWLPGMRLNIARSALERDPERVAVICAGEDGRIERHTLGEVRDGAMAVAAALEAAGYAPGDALAIDMPMTYTSVLVYLGIVAFGAAAVSIADSFAPGEIATRLRIASAKGIFTQDVIVRGGKTLPLYERVVAAEAPPAIVVPARASLSMPLREGDRSYADFLAAGAREAGTATYFIADAQDTTNVLFSSGTTGDPKAIPWTHVTPIKAAADGWAHHDIRPGDVVAWPTNLGWMMGPWLIYASLLNDAALALYDGSPLTRGFGEMVQNVGVTMLGVVPSLVKAWRQGDVMAGLDWSAIRCFSSTGEASSPDDMHWLMALAGYKPVMEYCGGTEIGGGYISGTLLQPQAPSTFSTPAIGCDFVILDDDGQPADAGELALIAPMLGSSGRLLNRDHHEVYFAGMPPGPCGEVLRRHGDHMEHLGGGYVRAHGRVDDTMNLGGIKTSSAEIERVCNRVAGVHETAAIAVPPIGGGPSELVIYAVADGEPEALRERFNAAIKRELNPLFKVTAVARVDALPRTASGKVMRRVLRRRYAEERGG